MGAGLAIPDSLDADCARELCGAHFDQDAFDAMALGGVCTREQLVQAARLRGLELSLRENKRKTFFNGGNEGNATSSSCQFIAVHTAGEQQLRERDTDLKPSQAHGAGETGEAEEKGAAWELAGSESFGPLSRRSRSRSPSHMRYRSLSRSRSRSESPLAGPT